MQADHDDPARIDEFSIELRAHGERTSLWLEGEEVGEFNIPFTPEQVRTALEDLWSNRSNADPLVWLGSGLYSALFNGPLGRRLWARLDEAERGRRGLRLRILTNLERTQHLPWELMFDPSRGDFMCLSGRMTLVRTRPDGVSWQEPLPALRRLRILAVTADPQGAMRAHEDLERLQQFAEALPQVVELTAMRDVSHAVLTQALEAGHYDVFHFAGTGENLPIVKRGGGLVQALRLVGGPNAPPLIDRQDLGAMLRRSRVRLAVLNGCDTDWVARSLAKYVPSAMGFRGAVGVESCVALCGVLYRMLLWGQALDLAVTATRQTLNRTQPGTGDWGNLVFYLQQPGGVLLDPQPARDEPAALPQSQPQAALSEQAQPSKEVAALTRLLEVHRSNLAALERNAASAIGEGADARREDLRRRIEETQQRVQAAMRRGPAR